MIDGVPDTFAVGSNPVVAFQPPQAAVSEFKVQTSAFDASLGHTPGAVVNLITKSGTNQFRGEVHEWLSNSALDAGQFFVNRSGQKKQVYQDNRYGASLGGPMQIPNVYDGRNRTFFFYAWEANKWGKPLKQLDPNFQIRTFPHFLAGVRADGQSKWDFSLIRYFQLTAERVRLQFRAECYDALNHPNFDAPNMTAAAKDFGKVKGQGGTSRQFQFALKLTF